MAYSDKEIYKSLIHEFTSHTADTSVTLQAGPGQSLYIPSLYNSSFYNSSSTITNLNSTNITVGNLVVSGGSSGGTGIFTNMTATNGTITNLIATSGTIPSLFSTSNTSTNLTVTSGTIASLLVTNEKVTNSTITNLSVTSGTISGLSVTNAIITNCSTTNLSVSATPVNNNDAANKAYVDLKTQNSALTVTQNSHGFSIGNWLYLNSGTYTLANDTTTTTAEVVGVVTSVIDSNNFILSTKGYVSGLSGLSAGTTYFLSTSPGIMTTTQEATIGYVDKPLFVASTTTAGFIENYRGLVVPSGFVNSSIGTIGTLLTTNTNITAATISSLNLTTNITSPFFVIPGGRLTTVSGSPVTITDSTSATTIYYTPYKGNLVSLYNGSNWTIYSFTELSLSLSGFTNNNCYDIFMNISGGVPALSSLAWTNNTTRATALVFQNGAYVLTGTLTKLYLGSVYITSTGTTKDSYLSRCVWNYYNRIQRPMLSQYSGSFSTGGNAYVNLNSVFFQYIVGLIEDAMSCGFTLTSVCNVANSTSTAGLGVNTNSAYTGQFYSRTTAVGTGQPTVMVMLMTDFPPNIGLTTIYWMVRMEAGGGNTTWSAPASITGMVLA